MKTLAVLAALAPILFALVGCSGAPTAVGSSTDDQALSATGKTYEGSYVAQSDEALHFDTLKFESSGHFEADLDDGSSESGTWSVKAGKGTDSDTLKLDVDGADPATYDIGHMVGAGYIVAGGIELTRDGHRQVLSFASADPQPSCLTLTCENGYACDQSSGTARCVAVQTQNDCEQAGGSCVALAPGSCAGGTVGDANSYSCGGGLGVECCLPQ